MRGPIALVNHSARTVGEHADRRELERHIAHWPKDGPIIREEQLQASWRALITQARACGDRNVLLAIAALHADLEAFLNR